MFCPKCRYQYVEGITECPNCQVSLVRKLPEEAAQHENLVVLRVYHTRHEAEFNKNILDANDVESVIASEDAGGTGPELAFSRGMALMVKEEDSERAEKIFRKLEKRAKAPIKKKDEEKR